MKISLLTSVLNGKDFIRCCMDSISGQDYPDIEHVIIDGGSTDGTVELVHEIEAENIILINSTGHSFYESLNIGISKCSGEIIGILNADDFFYSHTTISRVMQHFKDPGVDVVYGDVIFVERKYPTKIKRIWKAGVFSTQKLNFGWMPPHSAIFCRKKSVNLYLKYSNNFGWSADYEFVLRLFRAQLNTHYLNAFLVIMRAGGVSNGSISKYCKSVKWDLRAVKSIGVRSPYLTVLAKRVRKISQFISCS